MLVRCRFLACLQRMREWKRTWNRSRDWGYTWATLGIHSSVFTKDRKLILNPDPVEHVRWDLSPSAHESLSWHIESYVKVPDLVAATLPETSLIQIPPSSKSSTSSIAPVCFRGNTFYSYTFPTYYYYCTNLNDNRFVVLLWSRVP